MFNSSKKNKKTYAIIGLGRFGYALAMELAESGAELLVMDKNEEKVRELREVTENAYIINSYDKKVLVQTGVQNCDVAVVCIGEQIDTSILTTLHLVALGIPTVIAKANSAEHGEILAKLGAGVVYPERDMAVRLAHRLETAKVLDFVQLSEKVNISKVAIPEKVVGKSVLDVDFRGNFGLNIIAIENRGDVMDSIRPDYIFRKGDILYVAGGKDSMNRLTDWAENN